jgi:hypothetical protein
MSIWLILLLFMMAGGMVGCLWGIFRAIERLRESIASVGAELRKINAKLERVEAVSADDSQNPLGQEDSDVEAIEAIEAAISNFENLKRIDLTNPQNREP